MNISEDFVNKFTASGMSSANSMNLLDKSAAMVASTIVATGVNTWNSFISIPDYILGSSLKERIGADTFDTLRNINDNWAVAYSENRDSVETASLLAGTLVPIGVAVKGMKLLQAGKGGVYSMAGISDAAQMKRTSALWEAVQYAPKDAALQNTIRRQLFAADVGQMFAMSLGIEVAILAAQSQSPLMEDYIKDPMKNILIGMIGGGTYFGAGLFTAVTAYSHIILRGQIAKDLGQIVGNSIEQTQKIPGLILPFNSTYIDEYQRLSHRAGEWRKIGLDESELPLTREIADNLATVSEGRAGKLYSEGILSPGLQNWLKDNPKHPAAAEVNNIIKGLVNNNYSWGGNTVGQAHFTAKELNEVTSASIDASLIIQEQVEAAAKSGFLEEVLSVVQKKIDVPIIRREATESKPWDARYFGGNTDLFDKNKAFIGMPRNADWYERFAAGSSERSILAHEFGHAVDNIIFKSGKGMTDYLDKALQAELIKVSKEFKPGLWNVQADYNKQPVELIADATATWLTAPNARKMMPLFTKKYGDELAFAMLDHQATPLTKMLREMSADKASIKAREIFKEKPNWKDDLFGQTEAQVFYNHEFGVFVDKANAPQILRAVDAGISTPQKNQNIGRIVGEEDMVLANRKISSAFADVQYINALNTVKTFEHRGAVYIAADDLATAQAWYTRLSKDLATGELPKIHMVDVPTTLTGQQQLKNSGREISLNDLKEHVITRKEELNAELIEAGASLQERSIRLNIPIDTLEKAAATGMRIDDVGDFMQYVNADKIADYLSPAKKTLVITTNGRKLAGANLRGTDYQANLDRKAIEDSNMQMIRQIMMESKSGMAKEMDARLLADTKSWAMIKDAVSMVNNELLGSVMLNSADMYVRRMGPAGAAAVQLGQEISNIRNRFSQDALAPIAAKIRGFNSTQSGANELNKVLNILNGTAGYRNIDENGRLYKLVSGPEKISAPQFDLGMDNIARARESVKEYLTEADGSPLYLSKTMQGILRDASEIAKEQLELHNTINRLLGFQEMNDIGLHIPSFNPRNKFISYILDNDNPDPSGRVRLLVAKDADSLKKMEADWESKVGSNNNRFKLIGTKSNQEDYNYWHQRVADIDMDFADISKQHSGASGQFSTPIGDDLASTMIDNWHGRFIRYGEKLQQIYLSDLMDSLDSMSKINKGYIGNQPLDRRAINLNQPDNAALAFKNILLGRDQTDASPAWQSVNNGVAAAMDYAIDKAIKPIEEFTAYVAKTAYIKPRNFLSKATGGLITSATERGEIKTYTRLSRELENLGFKNPFDTFAQYQAHKNINRDQVFPVASSFSSPSAQAKFSAQMQQLQIDETAKRLQISPSKAEEYIRAGSAMLTMTALKVLETGHAFLTAVSWPILTLPNLYMNFPKTSLGNGVDAVFPFRAITDGLRFRFSEVGKSKIDQWVAQGYGDSVVSELSELQNKLSLGGKGAIARIEEITNSNAVKNMSFFTNFAEKESRLWSLSVGYLAAKRAFPGISEREADMFAKSFNTRTVGNYHAGQRPALYQGTLGMVIGLFQTYMHTWAQTAWKGIEEKNFRALSSMMLSQIGMFGMGSMPLYDQYSKMIGENFSDNHFDLTTGTYRALPEPIADFIVHGLPASLGVGVYTRGSVQPRLPFMQDNALDTIAAVNVVRQTYAATTGAITNALAANGMADKSRAILEGLSVQSLSRPVARIVEMMPQYDQTTGEVRALGSITRDGNTIGNSAMVWSIPGVLSRVLMSRSAEEQIKRDAMYLSSFYGAIDSENRKEAAHSMKVSLRNGSLDDDKLDLIAARYLRSGTASGFRSALNEAISTTEGGIDYTLSKKIRDGSPFMQMIDYGW
jgi:hypothetical protein